MSTTNIPEGRGKVNEGEDVRWQLGFFQVPNLLTFLLPNNEFKAYCTMMTFDWGGDERKGYISASVETIALRARMSVRTTHRALASLKAMGLLRPYRRGFYSSKRVLPHVLKSEWVQDELHKLGVTGPLVKKHPGREKPPNAAYEPPRPVSAMAETEESSVCNLPPVALPKCHQRTTNLPPVALEQTKDKKQKVKNIRQAQAPSLSSSSPAAQVVSRPEQPLSSKVKALGLEWDDLQEYVGKGWIEEAVHLTELATRRGGIEKPGQYLLGILRNWEREGHGDD